MSCNNCETKPKEKSYEFAVLVDYDINYDRSHTSTFATESEAIEYATNHASRNFNSKVLVYKRTAVVTSKLPVQVESVLS